YSCIRGKSIPFPPGNNSISRIETDWGRLREVIAWFTRSTALQITTSHGKFSIIKIEGDWHKKD
ncbi:MAG: hypothetical protein WD431_04435, partial [Cyclobacteriaceae bacterium]